MNQTDSSLTCSLMIVKRLMIKPPSLRGEELLELFCGQRLERCDVLVLLHRLAGAQEVLQLLRTFGTTSTERDSAGSLSGLLGAHDASDVLTSLGLCGVVAVEGFVDTGFLVVIGHTHRAVVGLL